MTESFKDHFSGHARAYAAHRPDYPDELFSWLARQAPEHKLAWDCATGNGQAAKSLAAYFDQVMATDASETQIQQAQDSLQKTGNVTYRAEPAEHSSLTDGSVDLITVAQAFHWLNQSAFEREAQRVVAPGGILAIWTYQLAEVTPSVDQVVHDFYTGPVDSFWPPERRLVESGYRFLEFPWPELEAPSFHMELDWTLEQFEGYLRTWSAVQRYIKANNTDPVTKWHEPLKKAWGEMSQVHTVRWPIRLRAFRLKTRVEQA